MMSVTLHIQFHHLLPDIVLSAFHALKIWLVQCTAPLSSIQRPIGSRLLVPAFSNPVCLAGPAKQPDDQLSPIIPEARAGSKSEPRGQCTFASCMPWRQHRRVVCSCASWGQIPMALARATSPAQTRMWRTPCPCLASAWR